jgi:hypothetical protein
VFDQGKTRNLHGLTKNSCSTLYKTEKLGIIKIDIGLFSVPAPPFRVTASGGVFLLPHRQYNHGFAAIVPPDLIHALEDLVH